MSVERTCGFLKDICHQWHLTLLQAHSGYLNSLHGNIHPESISAYDLRSAERSLRASADAISAKRRELTGNRSAA